MSKKQEDAKVFAFLATFLSIIGFIIAILTKKDDKYVMYYAKQSLVIFIMAIIVSAIGMVLFWIPIAGAIIQIVLHILVFALWLISWIYALSGEMKEVPVVAEFAKKINL